MDTGKHGGRQGGVRGDIKDKRARRAHHDKWFSMEGASAVFSNSIN